MVDEDAKMIDESSSMILEDWKTIVESSSVTDEDCKMTAAGASTADADWRIIDEFQTGAGRCAAHQPQRVRTSEPPEMFQRPSPSTGGDWSCGHSGGLPELERARRAAFSGATKTWWTKGVAGSAR